jgi:hypothetical protein
MATLTLTINAARKFWASPMLICSNRNHVYGSPHGYGWNYGDGRGVPSGGYRAGVLAAMAALNTTWGADKYAAFKGKVGYRFGHEPTDGCNRNGMNYPGWFFDENFGKAGTYPYDDIKYALDEGLEMGAEFTWVVNYGSAWLRHGTNGWSATNHARDLYRFLNDPADALRPQKWRADPYPGGVKWFEMGNEMSMATQRGHGSYLDANKKQLDETKPHFASSPAEYATYAARLAFALKKADAERQGGPLGIKCMFTTGTGLHFDGNGDWGQGLDPANILEDLCNNAWMDANGNKVAAGTAGATLMIDGFITHNYPSYPLPGGDSKSMTLQTKLSMSAWAYPKLQAARTWLDANVPGGSAAYEWGNTEHFTKWYSAKDQSYGASMYGLDMLLFCMNNGYAWSNAFCMWHGMNNTDEVWFYKGNPANKTAWYSFVAVVAKNFGDEIVTASCPNSPSWQITPSVGGAFNVPHIHLAASKSADGKKLYLIVMNKSFDTDHELPLRQANVAGFTFNEGANIRMWKLSPKASVTDFENSAWDAFNAPVEQVLVAPGAGYHTLKAERMTVALYELVSTAGGGGNPPPPENPPAPVIAGFAPQEGPVGTIVTITGQYFTADAEVRFGGAAGPVAEKLQTTATQLVVKVPPLAQTSKIRITVNNQWAETTTDFTVKASPPIITAVTPMAGKPGDLVTIQGANFNPADLLVMIGLLPTDVQNATATLIQATVPEGGIDYPVIVMTNGYTVQTAGEFDVLDETTEPGTGGVQGPPKVIMGLDYGRAFLDAKPIDGATPYLLAWQESDFGEVAGREPTVTETVGGVWTTFPLETSMTPRKGTLVIYATADDIHHKQKLESQMKGLMWGKRTLHIGSRHLEVYFGAAREVGNDSRKAATIVGVEGSFTAPDPRWKLNQPLKGILRPVNLGPQWGIFDDQLIPLVLPAYEFEVSAFTFDNWGTAWTWGVGWIANGPANATLYLRGVGPARAEVRLDAVGQATITEGHQLFMRQGLNPIRIEQADGRLAGLPQGFKLSLGDTYMRFL